MGSALDEPAAPPPALQESTALTRDMAAATEMYDNLWLDRDETDNFAQKHDVGIAKSLVRPNVEDEVKKSVDEMLLIQLEKIKLQIDKAGKDKKGKKGKKGKNGKKGKEKGGGGDDKKKGGKKKKK